MSLRPRSSVLESLFSQWRQPSASDTKDDPMSRTAPSVLAILCASKRIRLTGALLLICTCFFLFRPDIPDWRPVAERIAASSVVLDKSSSSPGSIASETTIDWSRFAYGQYVTDSAYLCNSVMFFERLHEVGSKADRVMMYPTRMLHDPEAPTAKGDNGRLLIKSRDEYGVKLVPIHVSHKDGQDATWADSFTKLLVFNQTQYDRVLSMDSDSTVLQNMDELFLSPPAPVAMPRAYWIWEKERTLSSQLILVQPSHEEFLRVQQKVDTAPPNDYDMEIVNELYGDSALILPHRPYNMVSGEFRSKDHASYLGRPDEVWDPVAAYNEAKFVHFSDWPVPKPWLPIDGEKMKENQPSCEVQKDGMEDCSAREIWLGLYTDFQERRQRICELGKA